MSTEQTHYDIFLSYSRKDNVLVPGTNLRWVEAIKQRIEEDHARFSNQKLRIFYDAEEIRSMDDWRHRILGALTHSRLLLICSSPNYYNSEYCLWEWQEYQQRLQRYKMGEDTIANVRLRVVDAPADEPNRAWYDATRRGNYTDLSAWYHDRTQAMQEEEIARLLQVLGEQVWQRMQRVRHAENALEVGNLRGGTPYFVGRRAELRAIHEQVGLGKVGLVSAVHAQGGIGKTELAVHYARLHAHSYPAGIWMLNAAGRNELIPLIGSLALSAEFKFDVPQAIKDDEQRLGEAVLSELQRRSKEVEDHDPDGGGSTLLILDNVTEPSLLSLTELVKLREPRWLRLLATSRRGEDEIPPVEGMLTHLPIPGVSREEALDLLDGLTRQRYRKNPTEWLALQELTTILDGFTLALDQVGSFLGLKADDGVLPSIYLQRLKAEGLTSLDTLTKDLQVADRILHQEKQYGVILDWTLQELARTPLALDALLFASFFPSSRIPWAWLEALVKSRHGDAALAAPGYPDPWKAARRRLQGMRLLLTAEQDGLGSLHELTAAHLVGIAPGVSGLVEDMVAFLKWRCLCWSGPSDERLGLGELQILNNALTHLVELPAFEDLVASTANLVEPVSKYLGLVAATRNAEVINRLMRGRIEADPRNNDWQRDLSISYLRLGELSRERGDLGVAQRHFGSSLEIVKKLAQADPSNTGWQRDLSLGCNMMGDISLARGDLDDAQRFFVSSLQIVEQLAHVDSSNSQWQRDLSVINNEMGRLSQARGDLAEAQIYFEASLSIRERIARSDPSNSQWQLDVAISNERMGDIAMAQGNIENAIDRFEQSRATWQRMIDGDPTNLVWQRGITVPLSRLGDLSRLRGALSEAQRYYSDGLEIIEHLAHEDSTNAVWQSDLAFIYNRLGDLAKETGADMDAVMYYRSCLRIHQRMAKAFSGSRPLMRDLSILHYNLVVVHVRLERWQESIAHSMAVVETLDQMLKHGMPIDEYLIKIGQQCSELLMQTLGQRNSEHDQDPLA